MRTYCVTLPETVETQERMWKIGETIGDREGRMDICVAAAGIGHRTDPLKVSPLDHRKVS